LDALKASQSPKPISPEELQEQAKQIGWHSVGDDLLSVVYENEAYKNKSAQLDGLLQKALASNTALKDLPENLKDYLNQKFREEEGGFFTFGDHASAQFAKEQQRQEILKAKDYNALSAQQKAFIDKEQGFLASAWDKIFKSDEERLQDYKEQTKARAVVKQMETSYALLSNIAEAKNFFSVFKAPDAKQQAAFRQSFSDLATGLGFDKVAFNEKGEPFVFKEGIAYKVNDGFMHNLKTYLAANAGSMVGALAGASYGARLPVSHPLAKIGASVAGAAVGSVLGAGVDVALSNAYLNRKNTASELAAHMLEAGALSVAGDALFLGAKAGFKALKPLVPSSDTLGKMSDYIPIVGTFKRARDGNAKAVEALISKTYTPEQRQALKEFGEAFGGQVKLQTPEQQSALRTKLENKFGAESGAIKAFDTLKDIFSLPSFAAKQEGYIQAIRADESGNLLAFLVQAANSSPQANLTLKSILNKTTKNLENELTQLRLNKGDIKALFDEMQQGTKESYQEMEDLIAKLYPSDTKTTLNSNRFKAMQEELKEQGLEEQAKPYMNFVSKNIYNPEGVSFKQLNNALKTLNGYYKSTADPHLKDFIKNLNDNALRTDIKQGIEDLLAKEPKFNEKLTEIYSTALKDYATMKDAHKLVKALKITDAAKSQDEAIDSVLKFVKGQGGSLAKGDKTDNLSALT
ncbi:hypothetical protein, partial [Helicobacter ailurogastricus]|uniref:hypothetical protein n=1 Tax=Helicobacter ailurogastricus TaxID=1578720 RepID=UPI0009E6BFEE